MFLGQFTHTIDDKGRMTIPARFRASLAHGAVVTQGFDRNLMVYTRESFEQVAQKAAALSSTDPEARAIRRMIFGGAADLTLDSAGRILIPSFLREYAAFDGELAIVGAGAYFEVWGAELWGQELTSVTDPDLNARRFSAYDLSTG